MSRSEKIIWLCFAATSAQLTFLQPYIILVAGERTNLFSGLLCLLTLLVAVIFGRKDAIKVKSPEFLVSAALLSLAAISGLLNGFSSSCRAFVLLASGLGGFWCARILLNTPTNLRRFEWLGLFLLAGVVAVSLPSFFFSRGIGSFLSLNSHPLNDTIMLLFFAPLAFLVGQSRPLKLWAIILLCSGYAVLCLSRCLSGVLIPVAVLLVVGVLLRTVRLKQVILAFIPGLLLMGFCFHQIPWKKISMSRGSVELGYRIENYPFSWHIARQHPWFGIGLRTPREEFLKDYRFKYPYADKAKFAKQISTDVTADNTFITFVTGLGFPFLIIYGLALIFLFSQLIRLTLRPPPGSGLSPLALLLPLAMALAHFQVYDGLLNPQSSWFFHVLLGLIPLHAQSLKESEPVSAGPGLSCSSFESNLNANP